MAWKKVPRTARICVMPAMLLPAYPGRYGPAVRDALRPLLVGRPRSRATLEAVGAGVYLDELGGTAGDPRHLQDTGKTEEEGGSTELSEIPDGADRLQPRGSTRTKKVQCHRVVADYLRLLDRQHALLDQVWQSSDGHEMAVVSNMPAPCGNFGSQDHQL